MTDEASPSAPERPIAPEDTIKRDLHERIVTALKTCYDPEIPVDIYELGLIYTINITDGETADGGADPGHNVHVDMTLTSPSCPVAGTLPPEVEQKVQGVDGVGAAKVEVVWEPEWTPERMSEAARLELGMF